MSAVRLASSCLTAILASIVVSCSTIEYEQRASDYTGEITRLEEKLKENPDNAQALSDLGVLYFKMRLYPRAKAYLGRTISLERDARSLFYYGMTLEADSNARAALAVYIDYTDFSSLSPYRRLMEGRFRALTRLMIQQQVDSLVRQEQRLPNPSSSNTVAVFPLNYQGKDEKYSSLGKGLGELMLSDLGQVGSLKLVERIRVEAVLDELKFAGTNNVDPATAPRLGKFLSAGRVVGGRYDVSDEKVLQMDVTSYNIPQKQFPEPTTGSDVLDNLFRVEKELIFGVIKEMGITLTRAEKERIQRIPTKSIQAFIMYTKGLEREDAGDFKAAEVYYKQAVAIDPGFAEAQARATTIESLSLAGGSMTSALAAASAIEPQIGRWAGAPVKGLIIMRLQHSGGNIGAGINNRTPAEEAARTGAAVGDLPPPPKPQNK